MSKPGKPATLFAKRSPFGYIPFTPERYVIARALWVTLITAPPSLLAVAALLPAPDTPGDWLLLALATVPALCVAEYMGGLTFPGRIGPHLTRPELRHLRFAYRTVLLFTLIPLAGVALAVCC